MPELDDQAALRDRIADTLARLDAEKWGVEIPPKDHPFWQMYPTQADAVLAVLPKPADRAAVLLEVSDFLRGLRATGTAATVQDIETELRRLAAAQTTTMPDTESCAYCGKTIRLITGTLAEWWVHDPGGHTICQPEHAAISPRATPKPTTKPETATLAAALDGLHTLIATSSRDWGEYRVDAWLWAVLVGWDCEERHEHDGLCDQGAAMAEMALRHGWDHDTVAKARHYRAAVRALTEPADGAQPS